ncbi:NTP pyrophosphohydrolase [Flavobacterium noncentrifugens]|uniref:Predicted NTP pyrophosphohydrolase, NUDIX family n=1 Tax=Flavobacterium noncentrifugens TaxID=1128970 RepID=A0A1G8WPI0_9FLAO|nr:NUDIX domain-containing protein [Flavobacterium noncentrifugens]GEP51003.1 NTP pyrophosphohydrolase [Flavobacterium noncentrifugens]SDJ80003.1 Predicted NTP pyrophosphohydrolase, NUDIX family [Flavobacterium noncentrifugens]
MKKSAGILLYRKIAGFPEFLLVHPGGPFWKNKDLGTWSIPKGEFTDENPLAAAVREFEEETGTLLIGNFISLEPVKLKSGKVIYAWALEGNMNPENIISNEFETEWPPKSGLLKKFPEVDKAGWFAEEIALAKINVAQGSFILQLLRLI